jgi:hypothetical protein
MEFENAADRQYYIEADPAHKAMAELIMPLLAQAIIVNYTPGVFS